MMFVQGLALSQQETNFFAQNLWKIWNFLDLFLDLEKCAYTDISRFFPKIVEFPQYPRMLFTWLQQDWGWNKKKNPLTTSVLAGVGLLFLDQGEVGYISIFTPFDPDRSMIITKLCKNQFELRLVWKWNFVKFFLECKQNVWVGAINPLVIDWKLSVYLVLIPLGRLVGW